MDNYKEKVVQATQYLQNRIDHLPRTGLLMGTGLGDSVEDLVLETSFEYKHIPHFFVSTVISHKGRLLFGNLKNRKVVVMQGRFHLYEGYTAPDVTFPIRVMQQLGVKELIISNAAGGIHPGYRPGDIMIITDHINLTGANPLIGPNEETWGVRFPDMTAAYDKNLCRFAENAALSAGYRIQKGVYVGLKGPSLETPAEIRFLRTAGADAVGFSTVLEVIAAVHAGMKILGLSVITNIHDLDAPNAVTVENVIDVANQAAPKVNHIIGKVIEEIL